RGPAAASARPRRAARAPRASDARHGRVRREHGPLLRAVRPGTHRRGHPGAAGDRRAPPPPRRERDAPSPGAPPPPPRQPPAERPLSLDEIAKRLRVSRASVSTNIRLATASELVELVTYPGDRRDYYRMIDDAWGHGIEAEIKGLPALRRIAEMGLAALGPGD